MVGFVVLWVVLAISLVSDNYGRFLLTEIAIWTFLATSVNLVYSYAGILSAAQPTFFGLGAYTTILLVKLGWSLPGAMAMGVVAAAVGGLLCGWILVRMSPHNAIITSLIIVVIGHMIGNSLRPITGAEDGISLPGEVYSLLGMPIRPGPNPGTFYLTIGALALLLTGLWFAERMRGWKVLVAIQQNPIKAEMIGYNVRLCRLMMFVFGAAVAGMGGCLFAVVMAHVTTASLSIELAVHSVLWAIVGGVATVFGPFAGVLLILLLTETLANVVLYVNALVGLVLVVTIMCLRQGVMGSLATRWCTLGAAKGSSPPPASSSTSESA